MATKSEVIEAELARIRSKHGKLTRELVVKEAKSKSSPLHKEFEWDDAKAAHRHRLERAQEILTTYITVRIVERQTTIRTPMYVRDASLPSNVAGYVSTRDAMDRSAAEKIINAELDRIESGVERGRAVAGALDLQHVGIAAHFEQMLQTVASARQLLGVSEAAE